MKNNNKLRFATVCSGVGAPEVAMESFFDFVWCCENDAFPSAVLEHRLPNVPNIGDMLNRDKSSIYKHSEIDGLIGGTPCQGFSVAGDRGGLENDDRSRLTLEFVRILDEKRPRWFIWENVPGVFSSGGGRDFKEIIRSFTDIGYGVCWRVLDAQHFGVPQRRRRLFVVGYLGDWRPSYRVLFESESLRGNIEAFENKKKPNTRRHSPGSKKTVGALCARDIEGPDNISAEEGKLFRYSKSHRTTHVDQRVHRDGTCNTLNTGDGCTNQSTANFVTEDYVRKLTPLECERLQGFPCNWTDVPYRNKDHAPKGQRYKAMGNSMAVPVMRWLGERIYTVDQYMRLQDA